MYNHMGILQDYFDNNTSSLRLDKWMPYLEIYERHFERYRGTDVHVLEIGVFGGGSLQMWKDYFGPQSQIFGVDINPECQKHESERVKVFIGDQGDRQFLKKTLQKIQRIDILIDDGSHLPAHQIATFEELFPHISPKGIFVCEDLHTNYWKRYSAGLGRPGTFIEYSKRLVDQLSAWHSENHDEFEIDDFTLSAHSMHYYDSMLVIEKRPMGMPQRRKSGDLAQR